MITLLIDKLQREQNLSPSEMLELLENLNSSNEEILFETARKLTKKWYGDKIFIRALLEISNYCAMDCYYCGIRSSNTKAERFRLSDDDIIAACKNGYQLGFRTFVLQGGEDPSFSDDRLVPLIQTIRANHPDCAITLSLGERSLESYTRLKAAGGDRYLLRHETYDALHFSSLHPPSQVIDTRVQALRDLKLVGFQAGTGFMVGSPGQKTEHLVKDLMFIKELQPDMVGIGPFLPHSDTPFKLKNKGDLHRTLHLISILRLMHPRALIPSTTALATLHIDGRSRGILAGANVLMPNISPDDARRKYSLYNNKQFLGFEDGSQLQALDEALHKIGRHISISRGDVATSPENVI